MSRARGVDAADALAEELRSLIEEPPCLALVLGSGLGAFANAIDEPVIAHGEDLTHLPRSRVPGHAGRLVFGRVAGVPIVVQQGRVHLYEGWGVADVTRAVRGFARLGARGLVLTNAAGSLRHEWPTGTLVRLVDHLNLQGRPLLRGRAPASGCPYDPALGEALDRAARQASVELRQGVYAGILGPSYESRAEIEAYARMGGDAIGMSTVAEASVGCANGMRVAAVSCITNNPVRERETTHEQVVAASEAAAERFVKLLTSAVSELAAEL